MPDILNTLITDRTENDVERIQELNQIGWDKMTQSQREEWLDVAFVKGAYNYNDLNRVGEAMIWVRDFINNYALIVNISPKTDWAQGEILTPQSAKKYLDDLSELRSAIPVLKNTPSVPPSMNGFTYQEANDIEKILLMIERSMKLIIASFRRCGQFTAICGGHILPVQGGLVPRTWEELDALGWGWNEWDEKTWYQLVYEEVPS